MNFEETKQILKVLQVNYPQTYRNMSQQDAELLVKLWYGHFKNFPTALVQTAVNKYINSPEAFAPNVGQIMEIIRKDTTVYDADAAWESVKAIVRNVHENRHLAIKELDEIARELVTQADIRRWQEGDAGSMNYDRASFIKRYEKKQAQLEEQAMLTGNVAQIARNGALPEWYNANPIRESKPELASPEEVKEMRELLAKGKNHETER
jgi:hypothetical protein